MDKNILLLLGGGAVLFYIAKNNRPIEQPIIIDDKPTEQPININEDEIKDISGEPKLSTLENIKKLLTKYKYVIIGASALAVISVKLIKTGYKIYKVNKFLKPYEKELQDILSKQGLEMYVQRLKELEVSRLEEEEENKNYIITKPETELEKLGEKVLDYNKILYNENEFKYFSNKYGEEYIINRIADYYGEKENEFYKEKQFGYFVRDLQEKHIEKKSCIIL